MDERIDFKDFTEKYVDISPYIFLQLKIKLLYCNTIELGIITQLKWCDIKITLIVSLQVEIKFMLPIVPFSILKIRQNYFYSYQ